MQHITFTGKIQNQEDIFDRLDSLGMTHSFAVSDESDLLVIGQNPASHKLVKAVELNVPIVTVDQFIDLTVPALERGKRVDDTISFKEVLVKIFAKPQPYPLAEAIKSERHYFKVLRDIAKIFGKNLGVDIGVDELARFVDINFITNKLNAEAVTKLTTYLAKSKYSTGNVSRCVADVAIENLEAYRELCNGLIAALGLTYTDENYTDAKLINVAASLHRKVNGYGYKNSLIQIGAESRKELEEIMGATFMRDNPDVTDLELIKSMAARLKTWTDALVNIHVITEPALRRSK